MERLPRIQSRSRSSMSANRRPSESSLDEKAELASPGHLPPVGLRGQFLRRQKEEESSSRASSRGPGARRRKWDTGRGPGGPISQSAIKPTRAQREREEAEATSPINDSDTLAVPSDESPESSLTKEKGRRRESEEEIYHEGDQTVIEDEEGNVLAVEDSRPDETEEQREEREKKEARRLLAEKDVEHGVAQTEHGGELEEAPGKAVEAIKEGIEHPSRWNMRKRMQSFSGGGRRPDEGGEPSAPPKAHKPPQKRGPALAYQFGNTIIVEDEDGEVLKKYDIPGPSKEKSGTARPGMDRKSSMAETGGRAMNSLRKMGTYIGIPEHQQEASSSAVGGAETEAKKKPLPVDEDDDRIRFTVTAGGRRMSKMEFIQQMSKLDPKSRAKFIEESDVPEGVKQEAKEDAKDASRRRAASQAKIPPVVGEQGQAELHRIESPEAHQEDRKRGPEGLTLVDSDDEDVPFHSVRENLASYKLDHAHEGETAAQRRRRLADQQSTPAKEESRAPEEQDPTREDETPAERRRRLAALQGSSSPDRDRKNSSPSPAPAAPHPKSRMDEGETEAERKRRLGALGFAQDDSPDSESEEEEGGDPLETGRGTHPHHGAASSSSGGAQHHQPRVNTSAGQGGSGGGGGGQQSIKFLEPRSPGIRFAEQPRIPTKDERERERAEAEGVKEQKEVNLGVLGKLRWKK